MNNNVVSLNLSSSKNSFNIKSSIAKQVNFNSKLTDAVDYNDNNIENIGDTIKDLNLQEEEYSFEELMKYAQEHSEEVDRKKAEEARKKAEEARKKAEEAAETARKEKEAELEELYKARADNNGLFHPIKEAEIEEKIRKLEAELNVPHKPDGWESFCDIVEDVGATAVTFAASAVEGIVDVGETIVDGAVQLVGGGAACIVGLIDEEAGDAMKQGIQDFVSYDISGSMYDAFVDAAGIDEDIAYGFAHTAGNFVGQVAGYAAITAVTGGAGTMVVGGLAAAGAAAESAYANGATFDEAMLVSSAAGVLGAVSGGAMDKLGVAAKGATSLTQVAGYTATGAAIGSAEPLLNSGVEYLTYGNNDGSSYLEFMEESGGWWKVGIGAGAGGLSTGVQSYGGYRTNKYKAEFNAKMDAMTESQRSQSWEDYYKQQYGADAVEHASGIGVDGSNGSFVDPKAENFNRYSNVYNNINNMGYLDAESIQELQTQFKQLSDEQVYDVIQNSNNEYFKSNLETYDLITKENASEFIVFEGYNSEYKTANFNLDWPKHAGYDPDSITSLKSLIDDSPNGMIEVSRVGGDGGHAIGTDWTSTSSQRSIPSSSSNGTAGMFDGNKYINAIDVCSSAGDDISKVRKLMDLGYDESVAEAMIKEFNSFDTLPEIAGKGGLNEVLSPNQQSKYGYAGKAAAWETSSVKMEGGAGQMNSIFSWGTLKNAGIVTDIRNVTF